MHPKFFTSRHTSPGIKYESEAIHAYVNRMKCPETKFLVSSLEACSDPKFCYEDMDGKCKLKVTHPYYARVQGQMGKSGVTL